ncbi:hypothetical protein J2T41_006095 [Pseudomonas citronellolis]|uniref:hypothetical protein n=1 Tax=Pseudomonas citronellolis TaxID=53408 RepID=UPI00209FD8CE|nr:hypothetical protein [Pseudomonas citronellolis]MCP1646438.1 hypothetical protein [Pseudomonas citronellolis]MCP1669390.1 hypothetical protein [Pseudomonas citronellolis]MCP1701070.1 hypothetical protein [Pseudomonas citronellolis]MCP1707247.1 hypothetical protein [Pseudomonas citronellolis]MCP1801110.1 hypothetical protein [Pseudomonas citronellolis]
MSLYRKLAVVLFLIGLGVVMGAWLAARHLRPQLEAARIEGALCAQGSSALQAQVAEQNRRLDELALATQRREIDAAQALRAAQVQADAHEAAAQRLLAGHSDGEDCSAARRLIDQELAP